MAKKGCFILTDISGYTEFLTKSELDHDREALQNLLDVQLAHIKYPYHSPSDPHPTGYNRL